MGTGMLTLALLLATDAAPTDIWPINQRHFEIPIHYDSARRQEIKQLILYASTDQGRTWKVAVASPNKESFHFYALTDGTYWFKLVIVDRDGGRELGGPALKVLVDTREPTLRITTAERHGDEVQVGWEIQEDYLDLSSLKLEYRTADAVPNQWYPVPLTPSASGQARVRVAGADPVSFRMQVQDLAGNLATTATEATNMHVEAVPVTPAVRRAVTCRRRALWRPCMR